jgi:anti-sigma-K factor RskA
MSNDEHVLELIPAYALDCLDDEEAELVTAHLAACPACQAELETYRQVVGELAFAAPGAVPPATLRDRLMASIHTAPATTKPSPLSWWQTVAGTFRRPVPAWSLVGALVLLVVLAWFWLSVVPSSSTPHQGTMQTVALLGTEAVPEAQGLLVIGSDGNEGALVVEDLPPLDADHQYQLWLIKDGQRTSGAVFSVDANGYGAAMVSSPLPLTGYSAFGITIEPAGGSSGPTGQKVLGGTF